MAQQLKALRHDDGVLWALDQTLLPWDERWLRLRGADDVARALRRLSIRGAPLIGVAAAYGVALELAGDPGSLQRACGTLVAARPTAVNLAWAVERVRAAAETGDDGGRAARALAEAQAIERQETASSEAIAAHGAELLSSLGARRILTHCNTGALAAPGRGTALAPIAELHDRGELELVLATETRPLLQGARLTAYELGRLGIEHAVIVDGAAAGLIARGDVGAVIVGCDRVAANGDVANKVGTYAHALAAAAAQIPFVVAGPCSTIDPDTPSGSEIVIEQRDPDEVASVPADGGRFRVAPAASAALNPAFDITPAHLVTALVTERGVARPVDGDSIARLLAPAVAARLG
ncbi:MAG TPA: S-methyl-5-thioribose-1-phosphate isomerase [Solirubrobacteraceae bacterium]|nr:S-methyl-5-thioribose-1-phosphate isomerase [Solirubrobacteraceae bacterium]